MKKTILLIAAVLSAFSMLLIITASAKRRADYL